MSDEPRVRVEVTRRFDSPTERVCHAWLDRQSAARWLFATPYGQMVRAEIDARVGGAFLFVDRRDGDDVEHTGAYEAIDRPHRLVFTFAVPKYSSESTRVAIEIVASGSGSSLTLVHDGVLPDYAERTQSGWTMILNNLAADLGEG